MQIPQFCHQLLGGLGAGLAAVENDDVAELAVEGAAPRELQAHRVVDLELQQVKAWNRVGGDVWLVSLGGEATTDLPPFQVSPAGDTSQSVSALHKPKAQWPELRPVSDVMVVTSVLAHMGVGIYLGLVGSGLVTAFVLTKLLKGIKLI